MVEPEGTGCEFILTRFLVTFHQLEKLYNMNE